MKQTKPIESFELTHTLSNQVRRNHSKKNLSKCRHCGRFPVAKSAIQCPGCGGSGPRTRNFMDVLLLFMLIFGVTLVVIVLLFITQANRL